MCVTQFTGRFVIGCLVLGVGFVIGVDFGLFESVWLVVLDEDCAEGLCW